MTDSVFKGYRQHSNVGLLQTAKPISPTILKTNFPTSALTDDDGMPEVIQFSHKDFPKPDHDSVKQIGNHKSMGKLPKKISQRARFSCDADFMKNKQFDSIIKQNDRHHKIGNSMTVATTEIHDVPIVMDGHVRPIRQTARKNTNINLTGSFGQGIEESTRCSDDCKCLDEGEQICVPTPTQPPVETVTEDTRPPLVHWKTELDEAILRENERVNKSRLPGCGPECAFGQHSLRTCKANLNVAKHEVDRTIDEAIGFNAKAPDFLHSGINLMTSIQESSVEINSVGQKLVWVQVPCAVDSGACAHVTPANIFCLLGSVEGLKPKYYAADGSPITNMGSCVINAVLEDGTEFNTNFDVAKITRPLLSVHQMVQNGHRLEFGKDRSHLVLNGGKRVPLRHEGKLYMLDVWCQVPEELARTSPFVRQVGNP